MARPRIDKTPIDIFNIDLDFVDILPPGAGNIVALDLVVDGYPWCDPDDTSDATADILDGDVGNILSDTIVRIRLQNGTHNYGYTITCTAELNDGQTVTGAVTLKVHKDSK